MMDDDDDDGAVAETTRKKPRKAREYRPKSGTGAWTILVTLYAGVLNNRQSFYKAEIVSVGQSICKTSLQFEPKAGGVFNPREYYAAWCAPMLEKKGLIATTGHPKKVFSLTATGKSLAASLYTAAQDARELTDDFLERSKTFSTQVVTTMQPVMKPLIPLPPPAATGPALNIQSTSPPSPPVQFASHIISIVTPNERFVTSPTPYVINLIVDGRETNNKRKTGMLHAIEQANINYTTEQLPVGDYAWRARGADGVDYLIDCVIERKSLDDLAASIQEGRYVEQKWRLQFKSHLTHIIYLVEGVNFVNRTTMPAMSLHTACMESMLQNGFTIMRTRSPEDTARFLISLTAEIRKAYTFYDFAGTYNRYKASNFSLARNDLPPQRTLSEFLAETKRSFLTIKDIHAMQLMQLPGIGPTSVKAIIDLYPTPLSLYRAIQGLSLEDAVDKLTKSFTQVRSARLVARAVAVQYQS